MNMQTPYEPTAVTVNLDGSINDFNGSYNKYLKDMVGVYADSAAYDAALDVEGGDTLVYRVEENRVGKGPGALILGTSTVLPGRIGQEFMLTRGHIHAQASRAEIYHCISGHGVMLLDTIDGESRVFEMTPGVAVHVPGQWIHRSINVGDVPLVTMFIYNEDAGQDYGIISRAGGMTQLIVADGDGWLAVPNPLHTGYAVTNL